MPDALRVIRDQKRITAGTIVYECGEFDYGLAKDASRRTGIEHISVTFNKYRKYPCFPLPVRDLEYADGSKRKIEAGDYADDGPL